MRVLAISADPDDETLGCGGTLLKHRQLGDETYWLNPSEPTETVGYTKEFINKRQSQVEQVCRAYGFQKMYHCQFPTTRLHTVEFTDLLSGISSVVNEVRPDLVYMMNRSDVHSDHQIASRAIMSSTKSFRCPFIKRILMYKFVSETEMAPPLPENVFLPNVYSDISNFLNGKLDIMRLYDSELQEPPMPRSIDNITALARFRGASVGVDHAEAFMLIRYLF